MPDLTAIGAALSSLKTAKDIAQVMIGLRDAAAFQNKMIEFQSAILDAQASAFSANEERSSLIARTQNLEREIAALRSWDNEARRYQLTEVAPRAFVYLVKPESQGSEPSHWLCPSCFQQHQKSILQGLNSDTFGWTHTCPSCKLEIRT
jgi:hypothetical protein